MGLVAWGCAPAPLSTAAGPSAAPACPIEGCNAPAEPPPEAGSSLASCDRGGDRACACRSPPECTEAALTKWGRMEDRRTLACVSRMFDEACAGKDPQACKFAG